MCQVSAMMENCHHADQEPLMIITKEGAGTAPAATSAAPSSSSSPQGSNTEPPHGCDVDDEDHHQNPPISAKMMNVGDHSSLSLNLITSSREGDDHECTPGSPEFFLPANAYISSLDDPSSLLTSYTSPSDPCSMNNIWPNPISPSSALMLNCPSNIFSAACTSSDEGSATSCDQIPSHIVDINSSQILYNTSNCGGFSDAVSYTSLLQSHHPAPLFHPQQPAHFQGFNQMMLQGSPNHPFYPGSSPAFNAAAFQSSNYSNAAAQRMQTPPVFAPNTRAGMLEQCLNEAHNIEQEEQNWCTFLQPNQEDAIRGSCTSTMMMPADFHHHDHHHHHHHIRNHSYAGAAGLGAPHIHGMPMVDLHHQQNMEGPNARSPTESHNMAMQAMHSNRSQERPHINDATVSCCTSLNKRPAPDGEDVSWQSAEAHAGSSPLKILKRSTSFSSSASGRPAQEQYINYGSCSSARLSPPTKPLISNSMAGSPTLSNHQLEHPQQSSRKPGKSTARQSVCNDPQSVAARHRRERISERLKTLQQLVPNGAKVDLVTMLEKAISYVKSLQLQVKVLSTDEYWPTPLSDKYSLNNLAAVAKLAASTYN